MFSLEGHTAIVTGGGLRKRERKQLHRQGIAVARRTAVWRMRGLAARWGMRAAGEPDLPGDPAVRGMGLAPDPRSSQEPALRGDVARNRPRRLRPERSNRLFGVAHADHVLSLVSA